LHNAEALKASLRAQRDVRHRTNAAVATAHWLPPLHAHGIGAFIFATLLGQNLVHLAAYAEPPVRITGGLQRRQLLTPPRQTVRRRIYAEEIDVFLDRASRMHREPDGWMRLSVQQMCDLENPRLEATDFSACAPDRILRRWNTQGCPYRISDSSASGVGHVSKDHVHLLNSLPPQVTISRLLQWLKGRTAHHLLAEFPHLKKQFWPSVGPRLFLLQFRQ
jgi:hypothetical protein